MPFPSIACQTCKTRRIKCDGTRPVCLRCTKSRRICLETSVVKQANFSIHVENSYASGKNKRPRGPRSSLTTLGPHLDLQSLAIAYYLPYHLHILTDGPNSHGGLSECVSVWKARKFPCPMVDLAISSISLAVFGRIQFHPPAAAEASSKYSLLLRVAQGRIAQLRSTPLDERNLDACMLAVFLMGRFEGVTHRPHQLTSKDSFASLRSWSHHDGALALLKLWNDNLSYGTPSFIVKQSRRGLIKSALLRNNPLPHWMRDGSRFGEHGFELDYDRVIVRTVNLHHAATSFRRKNHFCVVKLEELNNEARELDKALQDWAGQIPGTSSYQQHIIMEAGTFPRRHFYSPLLYNYSGAPDAAIWGQYFSARILVNSVHLRILDQSHSNQALSLAHEQQRIQCLTTLKAMADSVAATIPFYLGIFKVVVDESSTESKTSINLNTNGEITPSRATFAVWPLTIAASVAGVDPAQQRWFRSELARLGKISGDGILESAESEEWAIL